VNERQGYIKLYRSVIHWEWFTDQNTFRLFMYCLLRANYSDTNWRGIEVKRGSFVTSLNTLATDVGISKQSVRTSLGKLQTTGEVTHKSHNKYSVVTINNYEQYQDSNTQTNTLPTRKQHNSNTVATTDNKNKKITTKESKKIYGENVRLTLDEYNTLISRLGEAIAKNYIERLDEYLGIKDKRYKSHYKVILSWYRKDNENKPNWLAELKEEQKIADNYKHVVTKDASEVANTFKKL
jgi:predicted ArsR family transcriptional regulator